MARDIYVIIKCGFSVFWWEKVDVEHLVFHLNTHYWSPSYNNTFKNNYIQFVCLTFIFNNRPLASLVYYLKEHSVSFSSESCWVHICIGGCVDPQWWNPATSRGFTTAGRRLTNHLIYDITKKIWQSINIDPVGMWRTRVFYILVHLMILFWWILVTTKWLTTINIIKYT